MTLDLSLYKILRKFEGNRFNSVYKVKNIKTG